VSDVGLQKAYIPGFKTGMSFIAVAVSAASVSQVAPSVGIPLITGYLLCGLIAGPFMLSLIPGES
jgi:hypothetical protein